MDKYDFYLKPKLRHTPRDNITYELPLKAIIFTDKILMDYAGRNPSNEGLVYWAGVFENSQYIIKAVVAPETESNYGRVSTSHKANLDFIITLNKLGLIQIAQVHSHPDDWVDHSMGDDKYAAFKIKGLVSIVVPAYCEQGLLPLTCCGVHRFHDTQFLRLSNNYVKQHFLVDSSLDCILEDLRK